ncbi:MAG: hypothetical protein WC757_03335 [Candidatus Paceibacterota bacterium]|jgi:hypothetical protein
MRHPTFIFGLSVVILLSVFFSSISHIPFLMGKQFAQIIASFVSISRGNTADVERTIILRETGAQTESSSGIFWLNSGGLFYVQNNTGETVQGDLPPYSYWRLTYAKSNSIDTDDGYHPQNILRLITNAVALNTTQTVYIKIIKDNYSQSPNRNSSNGIFLMSRYQNANNLYYAGMRVDGHAVIKRKSEGIYQTLGEVPLITTDSAIYDRFKNPSLLPKDTWIGIKMETKNISHDTLQITLFVDLNNTNSWEKVLELKDVATQNQKPILSSGAGGIRSDFMDIKFKDYSMETL